ncbi:hypothetical protein, partial [Ralstonia solanacearum]
GCLKMTAYKSEERISYQTLKEWALDAYYDGCRDHALMQGWSHEQVWGFVSYSFEEGFARPVENLMWHVILLVLSGGWHGEIERNSRGVISTIIVEYGLERLLVDVPVDEVEVFRHDLKILKLG